MGRSGPKPYTQRLDRLFAVCLGVMPGFVSALSVVLTGCGDDVLVPDHNLVEFYGAKPPQIVAIVPPILSPAGGQQVVIEGLNFKPGAVVRFGQSECHEPMIDATTISCLSPSAEPGIYDVTVTNRNGQLGVLEAKVFVAEFPHIERVTPASGPLFGRVRLAIEGQHFTDGGTVFVGPSECSEIQHVSSEVVTCVLPENISPGEVTVTYRNNISVECKECGTFLYNPYPLIEGVTESIPEKGLLNFLVSGKNFLEGAKVRIGDENCEKVTVLSPEELSCEAPAAASGTKDVIVVNPDGQVATLEKSTEQIRDPVIVSLNPESGRLSGGEFVTLSGTRFDRGMRVFFAEQECQSLSFVNASTLICETPAQPAGLYDVYVEDAARTGERGAAVI